VASDPATAEQADESPPHANSADGLDDPVSEEPQSEETKLEEEEPSSVQPPEGPRVAAGRPVASYAQAAQVEDPAEDPSDDATKQASPDSVETS